MSPGLRDVTHGAGAEAEQGLGERLATRFYFGPISRTSEAGWEGVGEFLLSLSELPFQSDAHEARQ